MVQADFSSAIHIALKKQMPFWLMFWEDVTGERGMCVLSLFISHSHQTHSYVHTPFPFWLWVHLGEFWPVSLGGLLGKRAVWRKRDSLLFLIGICKQTRFSVDVYALNQCQNSSWSVIVCCGVCVWMEKESGGGEE